MIGIHADPFAEYLRLVMIFVMVNLFEHHFWQFFIDKALCCQGPIRVISQPIRCLLWVWRPQL